MMYGFVMVVLSVAIGVDKCVHWVEERREASWTQAESELELGIRKES